MTTLASEIVVSPAVSVAATSTTLTVSLADGRSLSIPLDWYPRLAQATASERTHWRLTGNGQGIHWPDIEEDIRVEGLLAGRRSQERADSFARWRAARAK